MSSTRLSTRMDIKFHARGPRARGMLNTLKRRRKANLFPSSTMEAHTDQPQLAYGQGYSTDLDTIREQEYPLLNGKLLRRSNYDIIP